jgi:hypothetical protein
VAAAFCPYAKNASLYSNITVVVDEARNWLNMDKVGDERTFRYHLGGDEITPPHWPLWALRLVAADRATVVLDVDANTLATMFGLRPLQRPPRTSGERRQARLRHRDCYPSLWSSSVTDEYRLS